MIYKSQDYIFNPDDFRDAKFIEGATYDTDTLNPDEVIIEIDRLALTANTITYGLAGKSGIISYYDQFPAPQGFARMPFWGFGDVVASNHPAIRVGERLYGFYPLSTFLLTQMGKVSDMTARDMTPCRQTIAPFYNDYERVSAAPNYDSALDDIQSLLRPVLSTSFLLENYLVEKAFYNCENIIITSASSKTSFGFGYFLRKNHSQECNVIGLTSASNKTFVESTQCYDTVLTYDDVIEIPEVSSVLFDLAGNARVRADIHNRLGNKLAYSGIVGVTHWDAGGLDAQDLPGPTPTFWSGPDQIMALAKRNNQSSDLLNMIQDKVIDLTKESASWLNVKRYTGAGEITAKYRDMLNGNVAAQDGIIFCVKGGF